MSYESDYPTYCKRCGIGSDVADQHERGVCRNVECCANRMHKQLTSPQPPSFDVDEMIRYSLARRWRMIAWQHAELSAHYEIEMQWQH